MISILRRLSKPSLYTTRVSKLMESQSSADSSGSSRRLVALAQQLRLYKPPPLLDDIEEPSSEESNGKVVSQVGFPESATPIARDPERFRPKRAAVLICLFEGNDGDLRVILTKRSSRLSTHSGEVALPGGKAEEGDEDDGATATREAKEEIGLDPSLVNVVAVLEPFLSKHLLRVVPVIAIMNERNAFSPRPNPAEVEEVFDAPLDMFIKDENRRSEEREWMGCKYLVHFFDYETKNKKYVIWGLTAGILIRAASIVLQSSPPFLEQNPIFKEPKIKFQNRGSQQYHVLRKLSLRVNARNKLAAVARISSSLNMMHSIESISSCPLTGLAGLPGFRTHSFF